MLSAVVRSARLPRHDLWPGLLHSGNEKIQPVIYDRPRDFADGTCEGKYRIFLRPHVIELPSDFSLLDCHFLLYDSRWLYLLHFHIVVG
jgi:hypothetical protein